MMCTNLQSLYQFILVFKMQLMDKASKNYESQSSRSLEKKSVNILILVIVVAPGGS